MAANKPFSVNLSRFDPYKSFRFLVYFGSSATPVAGVSKVGALKRSADVIEHKVGGDALIRKGLGRVKYDPIVLERGITYANEFELWANAAQVLDTGSPSTSLANLRQQVRIDLLNEQSVPVHRYVIYRAWVSEYQATPDLDAGTNAVAIEHIKIENEGWEHILSLTETAEF